MSPFDPSEYGRIRYRSLLAPVEFRLLNHQHQPVKVGFGELDARVTPGIYKMQMFAGSNYDEQFITIEPGQDHIIDNYALDFPTTIPVLGSSTTHEFHSAAVLKYSQHPMHDLGNGGRLMIYVRNVVIYDDVLAKTIVDPTPLSIHDQEGILLSDIHHTWHIDQTYGFAVWSASVATGGYMLRWSDIEGASATYDQAVWVEDNWTTVVFLPYYPSRKINRLERRGAVVQMYRLDDGFTGFFDPAAARSSTAAEIALNGIREGRATLDPSEMNVLLSAKIENPMLGFLGAHNLLLSKKRDWSLVENVIENLRRMVPSHPDLAGLAAAYAVARGEGIAPQLACHWPPTLSIGYRALLALDAKDETVIPENTVLERIAPVMLSNAWTSWKTLEAGIAEDDEVSPEMSFKELLLPIIKDLIDTKTIRNLSIIEPLIASSVDSFIHSKSTKSHWQEKVEAIQLDPIVRKITNALQEALKYDDTVDLKDLIIQVQLPSVSVKRVLRQLGKIIANGVITAAKRKQ